MPAKKFIVIFAFFVVSCALLIAARWQLVEQKPPLDTPAEEEVADVVEAAPSSHPSRQQVTELLHAQKHKMQQCQADNEAATGQLDVQIEILPSGQVGQMQTYSSSIKNLQLQNCALEVLKSAVFPSFKGPKLVVRHRVRFE